MELLLRIKGLDVMAQPVNLNVEGRNGFKTFFGLLMTIFYFLGLASIAVYIGATYFDTTGPTVISQATEESVYPVQNLGENRILPALFVSTPFGQLFPASDVLKYITPLYYQLTINTTIGADGVTTSTATTVKQIPVIPCSLVLSNPKSAKMYDAYMDGNIIFKLNATKSLFCANTTEDQLKIEGGGDDLVQSYFLLELYPCSLTDTSQCATSRDLMGIRIGNMGPSVSLDLSNFEKPIELNVHVGPIYSLSEQLLQKYYYKLARTVVNDVYGLTNVPILRVNYSTAITPIVNSGSRIASQLTCTIPQILNKSCLPYMSFLYASSGLKTSITRTYKTIMRTLSEIGGMNTLAFIIFYYCTILYSYLTEQENFVKMIFPFIYSNDFQQKVSEESKDEQGKVSKSLFKKNMSKIKLEAYNSIVKCLDLLNIVQEMNNLKILTHIMMNKHHRAMAPLVALNIHSEAPTEVLSKPIESSTVGDKSLSPTTNKKVNLPHYNQVEQPTGNCNRKIANLRSRQAAPTFMESIYYLKEQTNKADVPMNLQHADRLPVLSLEEQSSLFCMQSLQKPESLLGFVLKHSVESNPKTSNNLDQVEYQNSSGVEYSKIKEQKICIGSPVRKKLSTNQERITFSLNSPGLAYHNENVVKEIKKKGIATSQMVNPFMEISPLEIRTNRIDDSSLKPEQPMKGSVLGLRNGLRVTNHLLMKKSPNTTENNLDDSNAVKLMHP
jgi:hypothetical protein